MINLQFEQLKKTNQLVSSIFMSKGQFEQFKYSNPIISGIFMSNGHPEQ